MIYDVTRKPPRIYGTENEERHIVDHDNDRHM